VSRPACAVWPMSEASLGGSHGATRAYQAAVIAPSATAVSDRVAPVAQVWWSEHEEVMGNALGKTSGVGAHQRGPAPMGWRRRDGVVAFHRGGGAPMNGGSVVGSYSSGWGKGW
jgi:hypothetical protein